MSGNSFGRLFTLTTFGESHGAALGAIVDGCPPGLELTEADLQRANLRENRYLRDIAFEARAVSGHARIAALAAARADQAAEAPA